MAVYPACLGECSRCAADAYGQARLSACAGQVTYGLVTRARPSEQRNGDAAEPNGQNGTAGLSVASREWELQKYKQDMERLPEVGTPALAPE